MVEISRPGDLLASALGRALGTADAAEALLRVLEAALPGDASPEARLRKVVLEYDFDGGSIAHVSAMMGISQRHLLRLRSEAVTAMAYYIRKVLDPQVILQLVEQALAEISGRHLAHA